MKVSVVCVFWGDKFSLDYVYNLKSMVERNTTVEHEFVCFTDRDDIPGVKTKKLVNGLKGWWNKLQIFDRRHNLNERVVFFDLDTVIVNNIDWLMEWNGLFMGIEDLGATNPHQPHLKNRLQSPILAFDYNKNHDIWSHFIKNLDKILITYRGDGEYLHGVIPQSRRVLLQNVFPDKIKSYKYHVYPNKPNEKTSIVCFHGRPSIIQAMSETVRTPMRIYEPQKWIKDYWKNE
jgi:hypothetical protein